MLGEEVGRLRLSNILDQDTLPGTAPSRVRHGFALVRGVSGRGGGRSRVAIGEVALTRVVLVGVALVRVAPTRRPSHLFSMKALLPYRRFLSAIAGLLLLFWGSSDASGVRVCAHHLADHHAESAHSDPAHGDHADHGAHPSESAPSPDGPPSCDCGSECLGGGGPPPHSEPAVASTAGSVGVPTSTARPRVAGLFIPPSRLPHVLPYAQAPPADS